MARSMKEWDWINREFIKSRGLKNKLVPTGYEAFRVSPRTTMMFGKPYKKIYGAVVEPDYSRPTSKKNRYGAKVSWHPHGFTSARVKGGTRLLQPLRFYPVDIQEARSKLMLRKRRK